MPLDPKNSPAAFWQMARAMAVYSARAYTTATATDRMTNASAMIITDKDGDIIVAFKGSSSVRDFLQDADIRWRNFGYSESTYPPKVHRGFFEDFVAIDIAVVSQVRGYLQGRPNAKIFVTGHSLGGAEAIFGAFELARQGLPVAGVFTFGQPRVGNGNFCAMYDRSLGEITYRVVNQNDIVPRIPAWLGGYRHCGQEIFLEPTPVGGWSVNPSLGYKLLCDALGLFAAYRKREDALVREHFIDAYQGRIQNL